jgi:hypothetical protein
MSQNTTPENAALIAALENMSRAQTAALEQLKPVDLGPPADFVTVGANSDPKIDELVYCQPCRDGNPPWHDESRLAEAAEYLSKGDPTMAARVVGPAAGIPRTLSYNQAGLKDQIAKGEFDGRRCRNCGHER